MKAGQTRDSTIPEKVESDRRRHRTRFLYLRLRPNRAYFLNNLNFNRRYFILLS